VGEVRRVGDEGDGETGRIGRINCREDGEDKLLGIEAFSLIFKIFCKLEKLSINLRLFHIINTPKFSRNS
jgi:hypothetical protein